jgi:hypothetical protein
MVVSTSRTGGPATEAAAIRVTATRAVTAAAHSDAAWPSVSALPPAAGPVPDSEPPWWPRPSPQRTPSGHGSGMMSAESYGRRTKVTNQEVRFLSKTRTLMF